LDSNGDVIKVVMKLVMAGVLQEARAREQTSIGNAEKQKIIMQISAVQTDIKRSLDERSAGKSKVVEKLEEPKQSFSGLSPSFPSSSALFAHRRPYSCASPCELPS
jgi:hypothetical protein